jgi:hypothetical protein
MAHAAGCVRIEREPAPPVPGFKQRPAHVASSVQPIW